MFLLLSVLLSFNVANGLLTIDETGINYESRHADRTRHWKYTDIQELRIEPGRLHVLTYEDRRWRLNTDRAFDFTLPVDADWRAIRDAVAPHLDRRLVVAKADPPQKTLHTFAAKHKHALGNGCQGTLSFTAESVIYDTKDPGHSRTWTYADIESVATSGPYSLTLNTYPEHKAFDFQLQEPMNEAVYNEIWKKTNRIGRLADEAVDRILAVRTPVEAPTPNQTGTPMPAILSSVARVESAGNPLALSPKGARGLMQFMPATARRYGLRVDASHDDRTNPAMSIVAAERYLTSLYTRFGDWRLVLAGYNAGEGRVARFLAGKSLLPTETRRYVPAVLATVGNQ